MAIAIIEAGGTKSLWKFISESGQKSNLQTVGINPFFQNDSEILDLLNTSLQNIPCETYSEVFYYGTGVTNTEKANIIKEVFEKKFSNARVYVHTDMEAAARSLCGHEPGIAVILGTGSNSCVYNGVDIVGQVPSLGFWLGDEGSGAYMGKTFMAHYLRNELPKEVKHSFEEKFGVLERTFVLNKAYKEPRPNAYFASFAKFIFNQRKNPFVYQFILDAFSVFLEKNILKYSECKQMKVHFTGSISFYFSDLLRKACEQKGITVGTISESAISGLVLYHEQKH
jgi:glucosamine kinase